MTIHRLHNPKDTIDADSHGEDKTTERSSYGLLESGESEDEKKKTFFSAKELRFNTVDAGLLSLTCPVMLVIT